MKAYKGAVRELQKKHSIQRKIIIIDILVLKGHPREFDQ
jgi:hypothetical protein